MEISKFIISEEMSILEAMKIINVNGAGTAFVCIDNKLVAVITDGDIRRHILSKKNLDDKIKSIANYNPKYIIYGQGNDPDEFMKKYFFKCIPIVDENLKIMSICFSNGEYVYKNTNLDIPVVIMAGGKGTRLYPFTKILPKPLIPVGERTITEHIMDKFKEFGCTHFSMIVNYKKNFIKAFFLDNEEKHDVEFIEELEFLGTGGGLKLLQGKFESTFFMTNCDILIEDDYSEMLSYHKKNKNIITMICAMKEVTIPYGVVEMDDSGRALKLNEKPNFSFMTNTGLYIIEPEFLEHIPENTFIHITDLIQDCINRKFPVGIYPISENAWMDMGQISELEKMRDRMEIIKGN